MSEGAAEGAAGKPQQHVEKGRRNRPGATAAPQARTAWNEISVEWPPMVMEEVLRRENLLRAYQRVKRNGGAPGIDEMTVEDLGSHLVRRWEAIREELLAGRYRPALVRSVEIPKPSGGVRRLGIPTVLDRLIQQALLQVLQPHFDATFAEESRGALIRPCCGREPKFLGYTVTAQREAKLRVSPESVRRLKGKLRQRFRSGRGRRLGRVIQELGPVLRGWLEYYRLVEVKASFEELDQWLRRKLRCILWRQWKRPPTRAKELMRRGVDRERAFVSAYNGHGPWWNAGASHMHAAVPTRFVTQLGLPSLLQTHRRLQSQSRTAVYGTVRTVV